MCSDRATTSVKAAMCVDGTVGACLRDTVMTHSPTRDNDRTSCATAREQWESCGTTSLNLSDLHIAHVTHTHTHTHIAYA